MHFIGWRAVMRQLFLGSIALVALAGSQALAADVPVKAPAYKAPPPIVVHDWTGCYVGGNAGWIGGGDRLSNYPGPTAAAFFPMTSAQVAASTNSVTPNGSGLTGGVQVGCNWQGAGSPLVLGVEADFSGSGLRESTTVAYPIRDIGGGTTQSAHTEANTKDVTWFSTYRGRLGFAADRALFFLTGGLAVAHINSSLAYTLAGAAAPLYLGSDSRTRTGYTVGGGFEYAFTNNLSAKLEYLYLDFGTYTFDSAIIIALPAIAWATDVRAREHIVRVGLNYKLDWAPVVAKY